MSDLADKLSQAIEKKNNSIETWNWLDKDGESKRFIDMSYDELQIAYNHTLDMLYRKSQPKYGKIEVRKNIQKMYTSCNSELLLRYIQHDLAIDIFKTNKNVLDYINKFKEANHLTNSALITEMFSMIPKEYETLTIGDLLNAALDICEPINRKLISNKFIMSLNIWLTEDDKRELTEFDSEGNLRPWIQVMKERLFITHVSIIPTNTLILLRDKILLLLDNDLEYHIKKWTSLKSKIEQVADFKGWRLENKYDNKE